MGTHSDKIYAAFLDSIEQTSAARGDHNAFHPESVVDACTKIIAAVGVAANQSPNRFASECGKAIRIHMSPNARQWPVLKLVKFNEDLQEAQTPSSCTILRLVSKDGGQSND